MTRDANFPWLPGRILDPATPHGLSAEGQQALERTAAVLRAAWATRLRKPLRLWIEGIWLALGGPATLIDSAELAWCQQYFDLLEAHAQGPALADQAAFEQAAAKLYAAPTTGHANPVQVMTIHKSKGLEFDTVIIPGLNRGGGKSERTLLYWRERINERGESQLLIAPPLSSAEQHGLDSDSRAGNGDAIAASQLVAHLKHEQKLKTALEDARVLYVACTRAVRRLHLLFALPAKSPAAGSLLASLWPAFAEGFDSCGAVVREHGESAATGADNAPPAPQPRTEEPHAEESLTDLLRLSPEWHNPATELLAASGTTAAGNQGALPPIRDTGDPLPRHTGTILHRTLSRMVADGVEAWTPERIQRQRQVWHLQLSALGVDDNETALCLLEEAVSRVLNDERGRWLLDGSHPHSACELAMYHAGDDGLPVRSVLDRTFVDNGALWIIDYKSSRPAPGQSQAEFAASESNRYREQLSRYRRSMALRHEGEIRTALYFPLLPLLVEVTAD